MGGMCPTSPLVGTETALAKTVLDTCGALLVAAVPLARGKFCGTEASADVLSPDDVDDADADPTVAGALVVFVLLPAAPFMRSLEVLAVISSA